MPRRIKQPWERRDGEGDKPFAAFCRYLELGPQRSIHRAVQDHLTETSQPYRNSVYDWWRQWAARWKWRDRARAYDDHQADLRRDAADAEAIRVAEEQAERNIRESQATIDMARGVKAAVRALLIRLLDGLHTLEGLPVEKLIPHINAIANAGKTAQFIERLEMEKITSRYAVAIDSMIIDELAAIVIEEVPEDRQEAVALKIAAALKGERANGDPE